MTNYDVFCYGEIGVDNIIQVQHLPTPELAAFPTADSYGIGGAAANTAVWLAHFGFPVGLSGNAIGDDWHGRQLWRWLQDHPGLDLRFVEQRPDLITPFCRAMVTPDGERTFLVYWYPETPKRALTADMLHNASFLAIDLYGGDERLQAAQVGQRLGARTVICDVIDPQHPILPYTSIATNSGAYIRATYPGIDVRQHAHALQAISGGVVLISDGGDELYVVDDEGDSFTVKPAKVNVVDATGAGDALRSGLIAGLLHGGTLAESVKWGVAAGSLKVQNIGAANTLPDLEEVIAVANKLDVRYAG